MRKPLILVFLLLAMYSLTACGQKQEPGPETDTEKTPAEIMEAVIDSQTELPELIQVTAGDTEFETYLSSYYLLEREQVSDGALCYADGVEGSEIAVLVLTDGADAGAVEETLSTYIENRAGDFEGYAPQQAALVKNGTVITNGRYVALLICPDTSAAKAAFLNCFGETVVVIPEESSPAPAAVPSDGAETVEPGDTTEPDAAPPETSDTTDSATPPDSAQTPVPEPAPETEKPAAPSAPVTAPVEPQEVSEPVQVDTSYNSDAVLRAWQSRDTSSLGEINLSVYNAAKDVIDQKITDSMSDYEKELAIHDWITGWSSFSMSAFSHAPGSGEEQDTDTPYGVLVNKSGNCWGYSSTFQLFMDMLGIECITVRGTPSSSGVEHAWNMVRLDGEWYCVDTAWDDPIGGSPNHQYFNVTSETLRNSGIHRWDETAVPEAEGTAYCYKS